MSRLSAWIMFALLFVVSLLFCFEWRRATNFGFEIAENIRSTLEATADRADKTESRVGERFGRLNETLLTLGKDLRATRALIKAYLRKGEQLSLPDDPAEDLVSETDAEAEAFEVTIPNDFRPKSILSMSLPDVVNDPRLNPDGHSLSAIGEARIHAALTRAKAEIDILRSRSIVQALEAAEVLESRGEYLEIPPGERIDNPDRVLTLSKGLDGTNMKRIFYFYPEEFPDVYEGKYDARERAVVSAVAEIVNVFRSQNLAR